MRVARMFVLAVAVMLAMAASAGAQDTGEYVYTSWDGGWSSSYVVGGKVFRTVCSHTRDFSVVRCKDSVGPAVRTVRKHIWSHEAVCGKKPHSLSYRNDIDGWRSDLKQWRLCRAAARDFQLTGQNIMEAKLKGCGESPGIGNPGHRKYAKCVSRGAWREHLRNG